MEKNKLFGVLLVLAAFFSFYLDIYYSPKKPKALLSLSLFLALIFCATEP